MADLTYYFNGHSASAWTDPNNFDDGLNLDTFASVSSDSDVHEFNSNTCPGTDLGTITKVELRVYGYGDGNDQLELTPVFAGGDGDVHETVPVVSPGGWSAYIDITNDTNAPSPWTWAAVQALECDVVRDTVSKANAMYGSMVEIRVTYDWVPPVSDIDVGADPIDRTNSSPSGNTYVDKANPANASGTLQSVKVWAFNNMTGLRVGTFYTTNGNTLKCRDSVAIGDVEGGAERTFTGLSITVEAGDYIGCYATTGQIEWSLSGYDDLWYVTGEFIDPNDEITYTLLAGRASSLYGYGDIGAPPVTFIPTVTII